MELLSPYFSPEDLEQLEKIFEFLQTEDFFEVGIQILKGLNLYTPLVNFLMEYYNCYKFSELESLRYCFQICAIRDVGEVWEYTNDLSFLKFNKLPNHTLATLKPPSVCQVFGVERAYPQQIGTQYEV